uniref:Succinate dehydrogenase [ubiquinone] cytochrome b small subunit n=1 Tax=Syphacia muris TaxID=451379 RepID=A0A0N5AEW6_9BILA
MNFFTQSEAVAMMQSLAKELKNSFVFPTMKLFAIFNIGVIAVTGIVTFVKRKDGELEMYGPYSLDIIKFLFRVQVSLTFAAVFMCHLISNLHFLEGIDNYLEGRKEGRKEARLQDAVILVIIAYFWSIAMEEREQSGYTSKMSDIHVVGFNGY